MKHVKKMQFTRRKIYRKIATLQKNDDQLQ